MGHPPGYRESFPPQFWKACNTCSGFSWKDGGICKKYGASVYADYLCDGWERATPPGTTKPNNPG